MLAQLEKERKAHKAALAAKEQLEAELESLSQALFEEVSVCMTSMLVGVSPRHRPTKWSPQSV